ncbi:MAG: 30S ribosomal protein S1 [Ruminiclostridium sp.]|nr:30S ribosomal protein S1 [Ruminiclostridium sp.]
MSKLYLPEGRLLHTPENRRYASAALEQAKEQETVLEGRAVLCTPDHDLMMSYGPHLGRIPREEATLGIREGTAKEIAILSRVGKPVCFTVTALGDQPLFSRRRAQELALARLMDTPVGTVLPATVTHLAGFGAFVDVGCGVVSMIGIENLSVSRIPHPSSRLAVGQEIFALLTGHDREGGRIFLSHKELLGTWAENARAFRPGMTVTGMVRNIQPYGTFIELTPNLTGLTDQTRGLQIGDHAAVYIKSMQPKKRKIKLQVTEILPPVREPLPFSYFITEGQVESWDYVTVTPDP